MGILQQIFKFKTTVDYLCYYGFNVVELKNDKFAVYDNYVIKLGEFTKYELINTFYRYIEDKAIEPMSITVKYFAEHLELFIQNFSFYLRLVIGEIVNLDVYNTDIVIINKYIAIGKNDAIFINLNNEWIPHSNNLIYDYIENQSKYTLNEYIITICTKTILSNTNEYNDTNLYKYIKNIL